MAVGHRKTAVTLAIFSLYASIVAFPRLVDILVYRTLPSADCVITTSDNRSVVITGFGAGAMPSEPAESALAEASKRSHGFQLTVVDEGTGRQGLVARAQGSWLTLSMKPQSNFWLKAHVGPDAGSMAIRYRGETRTFDLRAEFPQEQYLYPALGRFNALNVGLRLLGYLALAMGVFSISWVAFVVLSHIGPTLDKRPYRSWPFFLVLFLLLVAYCELRRRNGDSPAPYGDAEFYWNTVASLGGLKDSWRNPAAFRGCLFPGLTFLMQKLSAGRFNPFHLYAIFSSFTTSLFLTVIVPRLYQTLTRRSPRVLSVVLFALAYLYFWRDFTFYVLTDQFALAAWFAFLLFLARYLHADGRPVLNLFFAGLCLGAAVNFHGAYKLGLLAIVLLFVVGTIFDYLRNGALSARIPEKARHFLTRVNGKGLAVLALGILLVSLPQTLLNIQRLRHTSFGSLSPFPYDYRGSWIASKDQTLSEYLLLWSLRYVIQGHPHNLADRPGAQILDDTYPGVDTYQASVSDFVHVVAARPWDYLAVLGNKLFLMMDIKQSEEYPTGQVPGPLEWLLFDSIRGTNLFSLLNHVLWGLALSFLLARPLRTTLTRHEIATFLGVFSLVGLPRLLAHVEWRYFMAVYALVYYIVAYSLVGNLEAFRELPSRQARKYLMVAFGVVNVLYFLSRLDYSCLAWQ